ncbi:MAG: hypothetical protein NVSMB64_04040 [Candidatus Velthaea sp.]
MKANITRTGFAKVLALGASLFGVTGAASPKGDGKSHRISFHVDRNEPAIMNLALNNIANAATYFSGVGEPVELELVAYGPGLHMLRADTSPVKDRLFSIKQSMPDVVFSACGVTKTAMEKAEGHPIAIVSQARVVPAGVVRLTELQELGWTYIKP